MVSVPVVHGLPLKEVQVKKSDSSAAEYGHRGMTHLGRTFLPNLSERYYKWATIPRRVRHFVSLWPERKMLISEPGTVSALNGHPESGCAKFFIYNIL